MQPGYAQIFYQLSQCVSDMYFDKTTSDWCHIDMIIHQDILFCQLINQWLKYLFQDIQPLDKLRQLLISRVYSLESIAHTLSLSQAKRECSMTSKGYWMVCGIRFRILAAKCPFITFQYLFGINLSCEKRSFDPIMFPQSLPIYSCY